LVDKLEKDKQYFWYSSLDGTFYGLKLNSINKHNDYICLIQDRVHEGWLTKNFIPQKNTIKVFKQSSFPSKNFCTDLDIIIVENLISLFLIDPYEYGSNKSNLVELLDILNYRPDLYIKHIDKLLNNKVFKHLIDKGY